MNEQEHPVYITGPPDYPPELVMEGNMTTFNSNGWWFLQKSVVSILDNNQMAMCQEYLNY